MTPHHLAAYQGMPTPVAPPGYRYVLSSVPNPNISPTSGEKIAAFVLQRDVDHWSEPTGSGLAPGALDQLRANGGCVGGHGVPSTQAALAAPSQQNTKPPAMFANARTIIRGAQAAGGPGVARELSVQVLDAFAAQNAVAKTHVGVLLASIREGKADLLESASDSLTAILEPMLGDQVASQTVDGLSTAAACVAATQVFFEQPRAQPPRVTGIDGRPANPNFGNGPGDIPFLA